ncbi:MAG: molybdopterin-dependent oxidoreductase [Allorhizobium sp.]
MKLPLTTFLSAMLFTCQAAMALEPPKGAVILTITGRLDHANAQGNAAFDLEMLEALEGRTAEMETPWTTGKVTFSGPLLRSVLAAAGAHGTKLVVRALNDYAADVPFEDATNIDTMLATRIAGQPMSIRDKGPSMLVYPFDKDRSLYNERYFSRSVWQIKQIEVVE